MVLQVLHDLPFSRNQQLKSADDKWMRIFKNNIKTWDLLDEIENEDIINCELN
jgi:hypothetical protein